MIALFLTMREEEQKGRKCDLTLQCRNKNGGSNMIDE